MRLPVSIICWLILLFAIPNTDVQAQEEELFIFAASSLTESFEALAEAFEMQHPDVNIILNFAGSSTLAAQISQGAPAHIFASANQTQIKQLVDEEQIEAENIEVFAQNRLIIVVPAENPANIQSLADLANEGLFLIFATPDVPIRDYTEILLTNYSDFLEEDFRDSVIANVVSEEGNVRQVLAKIVLGEADAGIVYESDIFAQDENQIQTISIPDEFNIMAEYYITPILQNPSPLAEEFISFVISEEGQEILQSWGFQHIEERDDPATMSNCFGIR